MSFADELRGFTSQKKKREAADAVAKAEQVKSGWPIIVELFYRDLKGWCVIRARGGEASWSYAFFNFLRTFDAQRQLLGASGEEYRPTQEEEELLWNVRKAICYDDHLSAWYAQDLAHEITARLQAEGLEVQATPQCPDNTAFPDVNFYIQW